MDVKLLSDPGRQRKYAKGQRIMSAPGVKEMYIVVEGMADVYQITPDGTLAPGERAVAGDSFGESDFFSGNSQLVFKAIEDTVVFVISRDTFDEIAAARPRIPYGLLQKAYSDAILAVAPHEPAHAEGAQPAAAAPKPSFFPKAHKGYPGVTHPEYKKLVYEMDYTCPYCGEQFKSYRIFVSKLTPAGNLRYDLRQDYQGFDKAWYEILTCPACYFSMFEEYFAERKSISKIKIKDALAAAKTQMTLDFDAERNLDFVFAQQYMALICALGYSNFRQLNMRIWANLSWLYEDADDVEMERYAALKSADASESVYMETKISKSQEQVVCLSTAGMLYRTGATKGMMKWLFNAKTIKGGKQLYSSLAERLMEEVRDERADVDK
jgi:uncharacterized protein (DUF2225 family)